ncbi:MAG: acyl-CoA thioesterase [Alphaproteobacteria bacterium]|nr:acyl-CoA thioesterase [Alphaproteobacteria bacterium]MCB9929922.1 acyl-CoA thioesterase [Alphaproteobacteria bacterium]
MFRTPITPRVSETDGAGHINNCFVPIWLEAGRREIFRILTPSLAFDAWRVALVNTNIDYTAQLYFADDAEVLTWVDHVGTKSFRLYEEVHQTGRLCARGTATYVYFNYATQQGEPIPAAVRAAFASHRRDGGEPQAV